MNFEEFNKELKDNIKDFLPERFADHTVDVRPMEKNNQTLMGLTVSSPDVNTSPVIYTNPYYNDMLQGRPIEMIMMEMARVIEEHSLTHSIEVDSIFDYENVKDQIFPELANAENNDSFLKDRVHTEKESLAVVYKIKLNETMSVPINNNILEAWGVSKEELHEQSITNMKSSMEPEFMTMKELLIRDASQKMAEKEGISIDEAKELIDDMIPECTMYVLSTKELQKGAVMILNTEVMDAIAEEFGDNFYVLPSSTHETILIPKDFAMSVQEMEYMVKEINNTQVQPIDRLSDHVFEYDREKHDIVRADEPKTRTNEKSVIGKLKQNEMSVQIVPPQAVSMKKEAAR